MNGLSEQVKYYYEPDEDGKLPLVNKESKKELISQMNLKRLRRPAHANAHANAQGQAQAHQQLNYANNMYH